MKLRLKSTGEVVSINQFKTLHPNVSLPRTLTEETFDGLGVDVVQNAVPPTGEPWQTAEDDGAEEINGVWYTKYRLEPTFANQEDQDAYIAGWMAEQNEALKAVIVAAAQKRLDDFAKTRGYDGILSAATYAASTNEQFAAEGVYAVAARDAMWGALYTMLAEVEAGTRPIPSSFDDIEGEMPSLTWPE